MGKKRTKAGAGAAGGSGRLTVDRARRSGHYQGKMFSEVYRDGKVYVYTAWDDNSPEVGKAMDFDAWVASHQRS